MRKLWDEDILYKTRFEELRREKLRWEMYVWSKMGRMVMELGVVMTRQNLGSPCSPSCFCLCQGNGGGRHERGAAKRG